MHPVMEGRVAKVMQVKAAQYVRMSTDKQIYSTANQMAAITAYASAHGFEIVRTYADEGRSGLRLKGRIALQEMLRDVMSGTPGFRAILVFDISRWGRFQDTDESAHYEFLCRSAGVHVHYCAESFDNDGSLASTIVKNLRRAMAGEFSRDLSAKVWAGQCRLVTLGYKMGGKAGYGLKRLLVDHEGRPKQLLTDGEHKSITSDRIILVPGDPQEIAAVKRIFRLAADGKSNRAIADILNAERVSPPTADRWDPNTIRQMLKAQRYVGTYVYNKRSAKLGGGYVHNPQEQWIKREGAIEPLISKQVFQAVQRKKRAAFPGYSSEYLLKHLRRLAIDHGYLSSALIDRFSPPASKTYSNRFGSLRDAYDQIGYDMSSRDALAPPAQIAADFFAEVQSILVEDGSQVSLEPVSQLLTVDGRIVIAPMISTLRRDCRGGYWRVKIRNRPEVDLVLACLMKDGAREHLYLFPAGRFGKSGKIDVRDGPNLVENFRLWSMEYLREMIFRSAGRPLNK